MACSSLDDEVLHPEEGTEFYVPDRLGSTSLVLDFQGNVVSYSLTTPYGERTLFQGVPVKESYLFTGREDLDSGTTSIGSRTYAPFIERWMTPDQTYLFEPTKNIQLPEDRNPYQYSLGNPVNLLDPSGDCPGCSALNGKSLVREAAKQAGSVAYSFTKVGTVQFLVEQVVDAADEFAQGSYIVYTDPDTGKVTGTSYREGYSLKWTHTGDGEQAYQAVVLQKAKDEIGTLAGPTPGSGRVGVIGQATRSRPVITRIEDSLLSREAKRAANSQNIAREFKNLERKLRDGHAPQAKALKGTSGVMEVKSATPGGARVYYIVDSGGQIVIVGKSNMANQRKVGQRLAKLYPKVKPQKRSSKKN